MFKKLANLTSMLKQAQQLGGQMQNLGEKLKERRATGNAGGGMVEVEVNGLLEVLEGPVQTALLIQPENDAVFSLNASAISVLIYAQYVRSFARSQNPDSVDGTRLRDN